MRPPLCHRLALGHAGHAVAFDRQLSRRPQRRHRRDRRTGRSCRAVPGRMAVAGLCRAFSGQGAAAGAGRRAGRHRQRRQESRGWWPRLPQEAFEQMVRQGDGLVSGEHMLQALEHAVQPATTWKPCCNGLSATDRTRPAMLLDRFERWDRAHAGSAGDLLSRSDRADFPAEPDRQQAALLHSAAGSISPRCACRCSCWPGENDIVVPRDQAFATARLLGTRPACAGAGLRAVRPSRPFHGAQRASSHSWRRIARWLQADIGDAAAQDQRMRCK